MRLNEIFCCAVGSLLLGCGGDAADHGARTQVAQWDTVYQIGTPAVNDTTLGSPVGLLLWGDRLVVMDNYAPHIRVFRDGEVLWMMGRDGRGPGEFSQVFSMAVAPNGNLWVLDPGNTRVTEISGDGEIVREISFNHLPSTPQAIAVLRDRVVLVTWSLVNHYIEVDAASFLPRRASAFPVHEEDLPAWPRLEQFVASMPDGETWISALHLGPGFFVARPGERRFHRYVEDSWFVSTYPEQGRDSARWGAHSVAIARDEVFMLFGGRPKWALHDTELPRTIDVYGLDGSYRRSYRLPFDSWRMATDGRTFYVTHHDPYPAVLALRARESGLRTTSSQFKPVRPAASGGNAAGGAREALGNQGGR